MQNIDAGSRTQHEVAGAVRAEMARRRVSQTELARRLGLTQQTVSRRLTGAVPFDVAELAAIAAILGVPLIDLIPNERAA